jgi:hypothetical protein
MLKPALFFFCVVLPLTATTACRSAGVQVKAGESFTNDHLLT